MNLDQLISRLEVLRDNIDKEFVEVFITEHAFTQGAVQCYVRKLLDTDIQYETNIDNALVFMEMGEVNEGIVIGFMPKYEEKKEDTQPTN